MNTGKTVQIAHLEKTVLMLEKIIGTLGTVSSAIEKLTGVCEAQELRLNDMESLLSKMQSSDTPSSVEPQ